MEFIYGKIKGVFVSFIDEGDTYDNKEIIDE